MYYDHCGSAGGYVFGKVMQLVGKKYIKDLKDGLVSGFPIIIGYFPVAVAFGLLSRSTGVTFPEAAMFSIIVFAGASQFMALDMIKAGISPANIILATFLLNLRHLMMSASLSVRLKGIRRNWLYFIAFGITDETFSVSSMAARELNAAFLLTLHTVSYLAWVGGTITGYLIGSVLPEALQSSLGVGLYAMFAALLIPEIRKSSPVLILSLLSAAVYAFLHFTALVPPGWILITTIIAASGLGVMVIKDKPDANREDSV